MLELATPDPDGATFLRPRGLLEVLVPLRRKIFWLTGPPTEWVSLIVV